MLIRKKSPSLKELKLKCVVCSHLSPFTHSPVGKNLISVHLAFCWNLVYSEVQQVDEPICLLDFGEGLKQKGKKRGPLNENQHETTEWIRQDNKTCTSKEIIVPGLGWGCVTTPESVSPPPALNQTSPIRSYTKGTRGRDTTVWPRPNSSAMGKPSPTPDPVGQMLPLFRPEG